jgi:hypothetical protein
MSRLLSNISAPVSRPTGVDYFLILAGCSLSLFLAQMCKPTPHAHSHAPAWVVESLPLLTLMLLLPQGIILLWPLFYSLQRLKGRPQALSAGEWLWGFAWLGTVLLTGWTLWNHWSPPSFAEKLDYSPQAVWIILLLPSMALIALIIGLVNLIAQWKQTWTHTFGLVLIIWPVLPLAALMVWTKLTWK